LRKCRGPKHAYRLAQDLVLAASHLSLLHNKPLSPSACVCAELERLAAEEKLARRRAVKAKSKFKQLEAGDLGFAVYEGYEARPEGEEESEWDTEDEEEDWRKRVEEFTAKVAAKLIAVSVELAENPFCRVQDPAHPPLSPTASVLALMLGCSSID
jgi:hypothetical protein